MLAVVSALVGIVARNLLLFVAVPAAVLVGKRAAVCRLVNLTVPRNPTRLKGDGILGRRLFTAIVGAIFGGLAVSAPVTAVGGTSFFLVPILVTVAAISAVGVAVPLYLLGAAGAPTGPI
jgi:hypothetical protein